MRSMPLRRSDQMHFVCGAEGGDMSPPTARPRTPSVLSARQGMLRETTDARLRDVGWEEAACVHTLRQSAQTVEVLMAQGRMPARPRRSPSTQQGGGGHRPHHEGRRGGRSLAPRPRALRRRRYRRSRWRRRKERGMGQLRSSGRACFSFCLCPGMGVMVVFYSFPLYRVVLSGGIGEKETL